MDYGKESTMAKIPPNSGKQWTREQVQQLQELAGANTPTRVIGLKLGRSEQAVAAKASEVHTSLKPVNQSPYGTASKRR